jgi:hypothetical protein
MAEDSNTFKVWIAFLASCNQSGIAQVSAVYIASVCRLPIEIVMCSIEKLSSPDEFSRSIEREGRRLERVDGGYKIINYLKYREFTHSDSSNAVKQRRYRERNKNNNAGNDGNALPNVVTSLSSSSSSVSLCRKEKGDWGEREGTRKLLDSVYLTDQECDRLKNELGINFFEACVEKLNAYLVNNEAKRKKYKNHNLVIRDWVITEIGKKMQKSSEKTRGAARWE